MSADVERGDPAPDASNAADVVPRTAEQMRIARIVVEVAPFHLDRPFDYAVPATMPLRIGQRVQVTFSGRRVRGLVVELATTTTVAPARLRLISRVLGDFVWMDEADLAICRWAADRFGAPMADVVRHALPARTVDVERRAAVAGWFPPAMEIDDDTPGPQGADLTAVGRLRGDAQQRWHTYGESGAVLVGSIATERGSFMWRPLPGEQVGERLVELARIAVAAGRGVLVVVPDPASLIAETILAEFGDCAVDLRSGISPRVRYQRWLRARCGQATVVVGERSAAFVPVRQLGLAVVTDEANPVLKEMRSPRHHAREVVLERARRAQAVGLVTGTVPSAAAWKLLRERRLQVVAATRKDERARRPLIRIVDFSDQPRARISREAIRAMRASTNNDRYVVVLAARAGLGRLLVCATCGTKTGCRTCGSMLSPGEEGLGQCDRCGTSRQRLRCASCQGVQLVPLAAGTRQLAAEISRSVSTNVVVMEGYDAPVPGPPAVLVMTRGSVVDHPPGAVGAVIVADLDAMLRRPTLNAAEDALRLVMALAQWAASPANSDQGHVPDAERELPPVTPVIVQTRDPDHHAVQALQRWDPGAFWRHEVTQRAQLRLPPVGDAIRIEVRGDDRLHATSAIMDAIPAADGVLGPMPTDHGEVLLIVTDDRAATLVALKEPRALCSQRGIDVRVEVDPIEV